MKVVDFKKEFDEKYELLERFNELDRTKVIVTKNEENVPLILFMRDQEILNHIIGQLHLEVMEYILFLMMVQQEALIQAHMLIALESVQL